MKVVSEPSPQVLPSDSTPSRGPNLTIMEDRMVERSKGPSRQSTGSPVQGSEETYLPRIHTPLLSKELLEYLRYLGR